MRQIIQSFTSVGISSLLLGAFACQGQEPGSVASKSYLSLDVGTLLQSDLEVKVIGGQSVSGVEMEFNPGVRLDAAGGYHFTEHLAAELSLGFIFNSVDRVTGSPPAGFGTDFDLFQVPVMLNFLYKVRSDIPIEPFFGLGLGGVFSVMSGTGMSESNFAFGYQGFFGLKYNLSSQTEFTAVYKILGTTDFDFNSFETEGMLGHMIGVGLRYSF